MLTHQRVCCLLAIISLWISTGASGEEIPDGLELLRQANKEFVSPGSGSMVEEDYPQLPSYFWTMDLDGMTGENKKRSHKYKNYMLTKDAEVIQAVNPEHASPVIRSYIPRTSSKRVPGAILNWALSPNQQKAGRFYSGYYRNQAHLRPAAASE